MSLRVRLALPLLLLGLVLCGCSDVKQINRITFVTALGIDKSEVGVKVHAVIAVAGRFAALSSGGAPTGSRSPNYILTEEAHDISEALFKMKRRNSRDIQFGHMKIILFSDELARSGLNEYLDLFLRRSEFQSIAWLALTRGSTRNVLETSPQIPESPSDLFVDVFSQAGSDTMEVLPMLLYQFYSLSQEPDKSPYAMFVENIKGGNRIDLADLGVFRGDKLVGSLKPLETMYLQLLQNNKLQPTLLTTRNAALAVDRFKTHIDVSKQQITIRLKLDASVDENDGSLLHNPEDVYKLQDELNAKLATDISALIAKLQKLHSDPVGFGGMYRQQAADKQLDMDEWTDVIFPEMSVKTEIDAKIVRRGNVE
ncbi:Ger(x)C family spore germination protein [Paenibacillus athensensis]|uniref:Ger(x)C family spore germination protein n=1 Tax=Paenibacillus athensensis TaxID=1967502 RepID=UPI0014315C51|nr:Ger(x)C family spore germination protein [Paenibacillus athensensis]MCD1260641.1 Ger(x)C family spore germination protein [Paenibacillus athensensis]